MQSEMEWQPVYSSANEVELLALEEALANAGIETVRVDQRDRVYPMLGQVLLLVHTSDAERAQVIVAQFNENEDGH
mgnify:CR=1 FL=1